MPDQKQKSSCYTASGPDIWIYIFEWRAAGSAAFRREMYICIFFEGETELLRIYICEAESKREVHR